MRTKSTNKFAAVFLALAMLLTLIPFSPFGGTKAMATDSSTNTYIFDVPTEITSFNAGDKKVGDKETFGNIFTVYYSEKTKIDGSAQKFEDDYTVGANSRLNFGGGMDITTPKNVVEIKADGAGTLKLWWGSNGNERPVVLKNTAGDIVSKTKLVEKNKIAIDTLEIPAAGTYYVGSDGGASYLYRFEYTKQVVSTVYTFDVPTEITSFNAGDKKVGDKETFGNIFTVYYSEKTKIDGSAQKFEDDYTVGANSRLNFGGGMDITTPKNVVEIKADGAGTLKLWWGSNGNERPVVLKNTAGEIVSKTKLVEKNKIAIDTLEIPAAGTYYVGSDGGASYLYKFEVTIGAAAPVVRGDWSKVDAPVISSVAQSGGKINVTVTAVVGNDGGDELVVDMLDKDRKVVETKRSLATKSEHTLEFTPTATGTYTFKATLSREEETDKVSEADGTCAFVLPLSKPTISSATNKGNGSIELEWTAVPEATGYKIYTVVINDDNTKDYTEVGTSDTTVFTVTEGLEVGKPYNFAVSAVRGEEEGPEEEGPKSDIRTATITAGAQSKWSNIFYGESTSSSKNTVDGDLNEKGWVQVVGGGGKVLPNEPYDGITLYYTEVPTNKNFTLRAKAHIDAWTPGNGQEGFGMIALDSLPATVNIDKPQHNTNQYMLVVSKMGYYWDGVENDIVEDAALGDKYEMKLGIGVNEKLFEGTDTSKFTVAQYPLETIAGESGRESGTYNIIGNSYDSITNKNKNPIKVDNTIAELTDFIFEIQKNNTGYFLSYYTPDGTLVRTQKFYDPKALEVFDTKNVYVGFFAARSAAATFSDVEFTTIDPDKDAPAEGRPVKKVIPLVNITSAAVSNSPDYTLMMNSNVNGTAKVSVNGTVVDSALRMTAKELCSKTIKLTQTENNQISVVFTPDKDQGYDEYTQLTSTAPVTAEIAVKYSIGYANQNNLYVAPDGKSNGNGGPEYPLDIFTAVKVVQPGQTIVVMEGTYNLDSTVRIERGIDGTADKPIRMIADPEAKTRPVFDFGTVGSGIRHGGNYWYFSGFDVTNSTNGSTGFRVCGNNNTLDQINTYNNGNTGVQISAFRDSSDPKELWPKNNLILNCTSYNNADKGYQDADGFAAKLTVGEGNVFDGCAAYNNADDGWDLFAKVSTGMISPVTIRNCVAFRNGRLLDGTKAGDGNGFKLGGSGLSGKHVLINSISFENEADGITSNSCPDVQVIGCTSYNNKDNNLDLTKKVEDTAFVVKNFISYKGGASDSIEKGSADTSVIDEATVHLNGTGITDGMFVSLTFTELKRNADGTIDLDGFLKLTDAAPDNAGADLDSEGGSTASGSVGTITPDENLPAPIPDGTVRPSIPLIPSDSFIPNDTWTPTDTDDKQPVEFEDNDTDIEVTAPADAFDEADEVKFNADPVLEETNGNMFTFDLTFTDKDGNKVQPKVAVTVKIPVPTALKDKTIYVYHVEDDGKYTEIDCKVENGMVVFTASKFSKYIITSEKLAASGDSSGDSGNNSGSGDGSNNPSTGVAMPIAGLTITFIAAIAVCVLKRKHD